MKYPWDDPQPELRLKNGSRRPRIRIADPSRNVVSAICPKCKRPCKATSIVIERRYDSALGELYDTWIEGFTYECPKHRGYQRMLTDREKLKTYRRMM